MTSSLTFPQGFVPVADERVLARYPAGRRQSRHRGVGGWLVLTNRRILFAPHALEVTLGGHGGQLPRESVVRVGLMPRRFSEFLSGGARRRLRIDFSDGKGEVFAVGLPRETAGEVRRWVALTDSAPDDDPLDPEVSGLISRRTRRAERALLVGATFQFVAGVLGMVAGDAVLVGTATLMLVSSFASYRSVSAWRASRQRW